MEGPLGTIKIAIMTASLFLLVSAARPECVTVEALKAQESSSHVKVTVVLDGKPLKGAKVDFDRGASAPTFSELTDDNGSVTPRELALGDYNVVAALDDGVKTFLWLHVIPEKETTTFTMDLTGPVRQDRQMTEAAEKRMGGLPLGDRLQVFQGTVLDVSGAIVSGANIRVVKRELSLREVVLRIKSDMSGHFSGQLPVGSYVAFFFFQGFRTAIVPFEIIKNGSGDLHITLQIAAC